MSFDGLKRLFKFGSKSISSREGEETTHQIDDEIDSLEKDIQESLDYANTRRIEHDSEIHAPAASPDFSRGGGVARSDKVRTN